MKSSKVVDSKKTETKRKLSDEEAKELLDRIAEGDEEALGNFIEANLGLVYSVVNEWNVKGEKRQDIIAAAKGGLMRAAQTFSLERGNKFSTYARKCIVTEISAHTRDLDVIQKPENIRKLENTITKLKKTYGDTITEQQIADELDVGIETVKKLLKELDEINNTEIVYLDKVYKNDSGNIRTLGDRIGDRRKHDKSAKEVLDKMKEILRNAPEEFDMLLARNDITYNAKCKKYDENMKGIRTSKEIADELDTSERNVTIRSAMGQQRLEGRVCEFALMDKQVSMLQISPRKNSNVTYLAWRSDLKMCPEIKFLKDDLKKEIRSKEIIVFKKINFPEDDEDFIESVEYELLSNDDFENKYVINDYLTVEQARKKKGAIYGK